MIFYISKLAFWFFMPISWILSLLFCSLFFKNALIKKRLLIGAITLLILLSNPWLTNICLKSYEHPITNIDQLEKRNLGIILTGVTQRIESDDKRVYFSAGADRVTHTVDLYKRGIIKHILVSGGSGALNPENETKEAVQIERALLMMGIPQADITLETESRNTYENAKFSKAFVDSLSPNETPILVTSAFHLKRSIACFKKQGMEVCPVSTNFITKRTSTEIIDFIPSEGAFAQWGLLIHEIIGYYSYKILGYC